MSNNYDLYTKFILNHIDLEKIENEIPLIEKWQLFLNAAFIKNERDALVACFHILCWREKPCTILTIKIEDIDFDSKIIKFKRKVLDRMYVIPDPLYTLLVTYINNSNIKKGHIFLTRTNECITRARIHYFLYHIGKSLPLFRNTLINPSLLKKWGKELYYMGHSYYEIFNGSKFM